MDDLISIAYTLISLVNGYLPWDNCCLPNNFDHLSLIETKFISFPDQLCYNLPPVYHDFVCHVIGLEDSATVDNVDYDGHLQAFVEYTEQSDSELWIMGGKCYRGKQKKL